MHASPSFTSGIIRTDQYPDLRYFLFSVFYDCLKLAIENNVLKSISTRK